MKSSTIKLALKNQVLIIPLLLILLTGCDKVVQIRDKQNTERADNVTKSLHDSTINNTKINETKINETEVDGVKVNDTKDDAVINNNKNEPENIATNLVAGKLLRIATEGTYPPFNYTNADGSLAGLDIDVTKALCIQMKAECQIVVQDWQNIISGLEAKKYDAIISAMSVTPERLELVDFTEPYYKSTLVWVAHRESKFNPKTFKGMTLGSQRSTTMGTYLLNSYDMNQGNKVNLYDDYHNAYSDLLSGRNDVLLAEKVNAKTWITANPNFAIIGEEIDNNDNLAIAVRKGDAVGVEFNQALQALRENGVLAKIEALNLGDNSVFQTRVIKPALVEQSEIKSEVEPEKDKSKPHEDK